MSLTNTNNGVDYTNLVKELEKASAFDLYRLQIAIDNELDKPERINSIKNQVTEGMRVSFFDDKENRLINAEIVNKRIKKVVIYVPEWSKRFIIPYYMLNIEGKNTNINTTSSTETLSPNTLKIGDTVGFNKDGQTIAGHIKKLNRKTVTLISLKNHRWRVPYALLYRVHDIDTDIDINQLSYDGPSTNEF